MMRMLCPNLDREDGLETVLEVPIPEEMFPCTKQRWQWHNQMKSWMIKPTRGLGLGLGLGLGGANSNTNITNNDRNSHIQLLLGVIGSPLIPLPTTSSSTASSPLSLASYRHRTHEIKDHPIEASMAKYIVQQYVAAMGGFHALNSIESMYALGKVKMTASEFTVNTTNKVVNQGGGGGGGRHGGSGGEIGGFVLWQKRPDLWSLELVVSGCKISAGSDGKVAWRQTPWHHSHASRGPARPLRRSLQGLDPRLTSSLFANAVCIGEKSITNEDCFILKVEAAHSTLHARSNSNVEIIRHTIWGYFSQRTGLLIQLDDTHLLRIKPPTTTTTTNDQSIFWETTMESTITDYRTIDGVNIAHGGKTSVSLYRYGDEAESSSRTRMEEVWSIVEVDFNIKGLEVDCFLPPSDLKREDEQELHHVLATNDPIISINNNGIQLPSTNSAASNTKTGVVPSPPPPPPPVRPALLKPRAPPPKISLAKIMAIDDDDLLMYAGRKEPTTHHDHNTSSNSRKDR